ncbi:MAG: hypothetical protein ACJ8AG_02055 [Ktedonobacteraceae bacterium]
MLGSLPFSKFAVFRVARLFRVVRVMRTLRGNDFRKMLTRRLAQNTLLFTLVVTSHDACTKLHDLYSIVKNTLD